MNPFHPFRALGWINWIPGETVVPPSAPYGKTGCQVAGAAGILGGVPAAAVPAAAVPTIPLAMTALGNIIGIVPRVLQCPCVSDVAYDTMIKAMWPLENLEAVKYATFVVLVFKVAGDSCNTTMPVLFDALQDELCDIVGVSHHGGGMCSAVCRRTQQRIKFKLPAELLNVLEITKLHSFKLQGRSSAQVASLTYEFLQAWGAKGGDYQVNFQTNEIVVWTSKLLMLVWAEHTNDEIQLDILACEDNVVLKRPHTPREFYVSKMGRKVATYMKDLRSTTHTCQELTSNSQLMGLESFSHLGGVVCRTFNVVTGAVIQYPVTDWLREGWFKSHTLILHGDAGLGKTPSRATARGHPTSSRSGPSSRSAMLPPWVS